LSSLSIDKILWLERGQGIKATGRIPEKSEFFQDHFPDFPVLPGVLALEMLKQTAEAYLNATTPEGEPPHYYLKQIRATKFSMYLKPGDEWESDLRLISQQGRETQWAGKLFHKGKIAVSAELVLAASLKQESLIAS
jgi:3-hydroxyacyl-[acyl-carrier-protein] dehydratase